MKLRRLRAGLLLLLAAAFGVVAMVMVKQGEPAGADHGAVVDVVVTTAGITKGTIIDVDHAASVFEVRQVPAIFVPPDALPDPAGAFGRRTTIDVPAGSYLTEGMLRDEGGSAEPPRPDPLLSPPPGMKVVEVSAHLPAAMIDARRQPPVDIYVTGGSRDGSDTTRRLALRVEILAVSTAAESATENLEADDGFDAGWAPTPETVRVALAVTEPVARKLIDVEVAGGRITLLASGSEQ